MIVFIIQSFGKMIQGYIKYSRFASFQSNTIYWKMKHNFLLFTLNKWICIILQVAVQECFHLMWQSHLTILLILMEGTGLVQMLEYHVIRDMNFMDQVQLPVEVIQLESGHTQLKSLDAYLKVKVSVLNNDIEGRKHIN